MDPNQNRHRRSEHRPLSSVYRASGGSFRKGASECRGRQSERRRKRFPISSLDVRRSARQRAVINFLRPRWQRYRHRRRASEPSGLLSCRQPDDRDRRGPQRKARRHQSAAPHGRHDDARAVKKMGIGDREPISSLSISASTIAAFEALIEKQIDAALLPPEKAFLAEAEGFRVIADSLSLDCHWVAAGDDAAFSPRQPRAGHKNLRASIAKAFSSSRPNQRNDR